MASGRVESADEPVEEELPAVVSVARQGGKSPAWAMVARVIRRAATKLTRSGSCPACAGGLGHQ